MNRYIEILKQIKGIDEEKLDAKEKLKKMEAFATTNLSVVQKLTGDKQVKIKYALMDAMKGL